MKIEKEIEKKKTRKRKLPKPYPVRARKKQIVGVVIFDSKTLIWTTKLKIRNRLFNASEFTQMKVVIISHFNNFKVR